MQFVDGETWICKHVGETHIESIFIKSLKKVLKYENNTIMLVVSSLQVGRDRYNV